MELLLKYGNVNIGVPNFIKQSPMDIKGQVDPSTIILGNFNAPVSFQGKSFKLKVKTFRVKPNLKYVDFTGVYRTFHPTDSINILLRSLSTFYNTDYILDHKSSLSKHKTTNIISCVLPDYSAKKKNL